MLTFGIIEEMWETKRLLHHLKISLRCFPQKIQLPEIPEVNTCGFVPVNVSCEFCCIATNLIKIKLISIHTHIFISNYGPMI